MHPVHTERVLKCNGCTQCCRGPDRLLPIDPSQAVTYDTQQIPFYGGYLTVLAMKDNCDCVYLDENGCSIWEDRPVECRQYDCRQHMRSEKERRRLPHVALASQLLTNRMKQI